MSDAYLCIPVGSQEEGAGVAIQAGLVNHSVQGGAEFAAGPPAQNNEGIHL